jgi:hypothetical protein
VAKRYDHARERNDHRLSWQGSQLVKRYERLLRSEHLRRCSAFLAPLGITTVARPIARLYPFVFVSVCRTNRAPALEGRLFGYHAQQVTYK